MKKSCLLLSVMLAMFLSFQQTSFAQNPEADLAQKVEDCDFTDPEAIFELATWAIKSKNKKVRREGRKYLKEVIELDEDHEGARGLLGYVLVGDKWLTKKKAKAAKKAQMKIVMKERGYVPHKGGWIKKTRKRDWNRKWEKDEDGVWHSYEDVMRAKGLALYKGQWLRIGDEDRKRMEYHRKNTGEDILITSTPHFVIHTSIPIKYVKKYSDLSEEVYDWYMKTFNIPEARAKNFFGQRAHIWTFETTQQFQDWITAYSETYKFTKKDKEHFRERPGGRLDPNRRLMTIVREQPEEIDNGLLHQVGVLLQIFNTRGREPEWMSEGFGHLVEELFSDVKFGRVNMSTNAKYANSGGIADKEYNTKDGRPQTKGLVKAGDDIPIDQLSKKDLNTLDKDNLAQGFSITEWMYHHNRDKYIRVIDELKKSKAQDRPGAAHDGITKGFGMKIGDFEKAWRKYVKKKYR